MKRPIADVRKEIRALESELTHEIISKAARQEYAPGERQQMIERLLANLKERYPNWELKPK